MTGLYLYCVGGPEHPEPAELEGIDGRPVRSLDTSGFRAWVSSMESTPAATLDRVRIHNAVVEASTARETPLPMRFGQWFATKGELVDALGERRPRLLQGLERVRGAVEFGVRIIDPNTPEPPAPDRSSGRSYMEALARREEEAERARRRGAEVAAEMRTFLGPAIREQAVRPGGSEALVAIAHLVARHDTGTYSTRLRTFSMGRPELRFVCSGPWPPYGFSDDGS